ncbi:MAG: hypothetical protein ACTSRZ_16640 [Promethearchaeota archaeon]
MNLEKKKKESVINVLSKHVQSLVSIRFIVEDKKSKRFIVIREDVDGNVFYIVDYVDWKVSSRRLHNNKTDSIERCAIAGDFIAICGFDQIELFDRKNIEYQKTLPYSGGWALTAYKDHFIFPNIIDEDEEQYESEEEDDERNEILFYNPNTDKIDLKINIPEELNEYYPSVLNINISNHILEIYLVYCGDYESREKYMEIPNLCKIDYDLKSNKIINETFLHDEDSNYAFPDNIISFDDEEEFKNIEYNFPQTSSNYKLSMEMIKDLIKQLKKNKDDLINQIKKHINDIIVLNGKFNITLDDNSYNQRFALQANSFNKIFTLQANSTDEFINILKSLNVKVLYLESIQTSLIGEEYIDLLNINFNNPIDENNGELITYGYRLSFINNNVLHIYNIINDDIYSKILELGQILQQEAMPLLETKNPIEDLIEPFKEELFEEIIKNKANTIMAKKNFILSFINTRYPELSGQYSLYEVNDSYLQDITNQLQDYIENKMEKLAESLKTDKNYAILKRKAEKAEYIKKISKNYNLNLKKTEIESMIAKIEMEKKINI